MWWRTILALTIAFPLALSHGAAEQPGKAVAAGRAMGYGILAANDAAEAAMGFTTTKIFAHWNLLEPSRRSYSADAIAALGSRVDAARSRGLSVMLQVKYSPRWATGSDNDSAPPIDDNDLANFMGYLAAHFRGRIAAYEIWNEPNLRIEWGMQAPDPVKFASMLRALYPRVKAADPNAQVITGGLSTTGDGISYWSYGDLLWIKDLYVAGNVKSCSDGQGGLRSCFDALGSHPYGGPFAPETGPEVAQYTVGMYFRRAEQHKQMMDVWGQDYNRGIWATEFNWLLDPAAFGVSCSWGGTWDSYKLTGPASVQEATQADYLVRAYNYAYNNWPWMEQMIAFTLDYPGNGQCDPIPWYSLTRPDGSRRPAYGALTNMPKPGAIRPELALSAGDLVFLLDPKDPNTASRTLQIQNPSATTLAWTATKSQASWLSLSSASGNTPSSVTITVNKSGLANGNYTATVSVSATGAQNSPQQVQVRMYVGPLHRRQLNSVTRG